MPAAERVAEVVCVWGFLPLGKLVELDLAVAVLIQREHHLVQLLLRHPCTKDNQRVSLSLTSCFRVMGTTRAGVAAGAPP